MIEIATVIAVPSALLYALGVVVFWLRIANEYDRMSIGTTWYAASLVPRGTAAASGIEVILRGAMYGVLASFTVFFIAHTITYFETKGNQEQNAKFFSAPLLVPLQFLLAGLLLVVLSL